MLHVYIYPIEIPRNITDEKLLQIHSKSDKVERLTPDEFAERVNDEQLDNVHHWIRFIDSEKTGQP